MLAGQISEWIRNGDLKLPSQISTMSSSGDGLLGTSLKTLSCAKEILPRDYTEYLRCDALKEDI